MHTAVATSLTPLETDASTDATARPRPALVLAYGAEDVPRIRRGERRGADPCRFSIGECPGKGILGRAHEGHLLLGR
jgi:hypothetical protein